MPTIEERLRALEQEHTDLKKTIELQTIAIGALVNKAALERLNEKYDKIFDALMAHDRFTNEQLAELDGKIVGAQTKVRQRFNGVETTISDHTASLSRVETVMNDHTKLLTQILERLSK